MSSGFLLNIGVFAWYQMNKTVIAESLCENKQKPQLNCHGKCALSDRLTTEFSEPMNNHQEEPVVELRQVNFIVPTSNITFMNQLVNNELNPREPAQPQMGYTGEIFHPPRLNA